MKAATPNLETRFETTAGRTINSLTAYDAQLPEFTRKMWASELAKNVWEPRLDAIGLAWDNIEIASIKEGLRSCAHIKRTGTRLNALQIHCGQLELSTTDFAPANDHPQASTSILIAENEALQSFQEAWREGNTDLVGKLLGYPPCCWKFFQIQCAALGSLDPTWRMACNTPDATFCGNIIEIEGSNVASPLWGWIGARAFPYIPCSFACAEADAIGKKYMQLGVELGYGDEMRWLSELLSYPVEWTALHGIAEIKYPIAKAIARTNATLEKVTVRVRTAHYPAEGAHGKDFPYAARASRLKLQARRIINA